MEKEEKTSCMGKPISHKVVIFHWDLPRVLLKISCDTCKHEHRCHNLEHKRDNCIVSKATEKLIGPFVRATVSGFVSEEFYIDGKYSSFKDKEQFKNIFKFLRMKYVKKNVR